MDATQRWLVGGVFGVVYGGMILGGLPRLRLDRTGVALLGAITIIGAEVLTPEQAAAAIHLPTILLLFSFMVISAQMRLGGFYSAVTRRIAVLPVGPAGLLGVVIAVAAVLSAVFTNDIVCMAMSPVLADACLRRRLDPVPYLLALACASNIGSAATLIGNPQNMLIGEVLHLDFAAYAARVALPVTASLVLLWALQAWPLRGARGGGPEALHDRVPVSDEPVFDSWQTVKGLAVAGALVALFLATNWPRDVAALIGAGLLLLSQRFHSSKVMGLIDWELLILFMGLFVVNHAFERSGLAGDALAWLQAQGVQLAAAGTLFLATLGLSNLVSNVPAVMLLLPVTQGPEAGAMLALVSTLSGNLVIVGSIANIIVVDAARKAGIVIDWKRHARAGVPVTAASLALVWVWL